jgi:hypothetical protein
LTVDLVAKVNGLVDKNRITYARKAMIRCGLFLNVDGLWSEHQLNPQLQNVIQKYRENFEGS